jgi:hypothetical protein
MSKPHATLKLFRKLHLYIGIFISPALLFFAFTGALQTLSLHESVRGSSYKPSQFLMTMAQIHKNATWKVQPRKPGQGPESDKTKADRNDRGTDSAKGADAAKGAHGDKREDVATSVIAPGASPPAPAPVISKRQMHLPLKIFFLLVSLGLFTSTLTGVYMTYKYDRNRMLMTGLLVAGVVIPLLLLPL